MVVWFVFVTAAIAGLAFLTINAVSTVSAATRDHRRNETVLQLEAVAQVLEARAASSRTDAVATVSREGLLAPVGLQGGPGEGYLLPNNLGIRTITRFGRPILYCPFGPPGGPVTGTTNVTSPSGSSYPILVDSGFVAGGRPAAFGPLAADPEIIGYVMAETSVGLAQLSCADVTFNTATRGLEVPNGVVRAVRTGQGVSTRESVNSREIVYFVSPSGSPSATGLIEGSPTTLERALADIRARSPEMATVRMANGIYAVGSGSFAMANGLDVVRGRSGRLVVEALGSGGSGGLARVVMPSSAISVPGDIFIRNVDFGAAGHLVVRENQKATVVRSRLGSIDLVNAELWLQDSEVVGTGGPVSVQAQGSSIGFAGNVSIGHPGGGRALVLANGSSSLSTGANLTFYDSDPLNVAPNLQAVGVLADGRFSMDQGSIRFRDRFMSPFLIEGGSTFLSAVNVVSDTTQDVFFTTSDGGDLSLFSSLLAQTGPIPVVGVLDLSAAKVAGEGSQIRSSSQCWAGPLFAGAPAPQTCSSCSAPVGPAAVNPAVMISNVPSGGEIGIFASLGAANSEQRVGQLANKTAWDCRIG